MQSNNSEVDGWDGGFWFELSIKFLKLDWNDGQRFTQTWKLNRRKLKSY